MLEKLSLKNFKGFESLDELKIKPLTILVGKNSCGKSSIMHSLLLLKQTLDSSYQNNTLELDGAYLQYSNLKEIAFGQPRIDQAFIGYTFIFNENESNVSIDLSFKHKTIDGIRKIITDKCIVNDGKVSFDFANPTKKLLKNISSKFMKDIILTSKLGKVNYNHFLPEDIEINITVDDKNVKKVSRLPFSLLAFESQLNFDYLEKLKNTIENLKYLSPVRAHPKRAYVHFSEAESELSCDGTNAAYLFWLKRKQKINFKSEEISLIDATNKCLVLMGLKQKISPIKLGDIVYKLNVQENYTNKNVSIADVGFGYSQLIPIILIGLLSNNEDLVLIEQPEIHLHPSSAGRLADLFLSFIEDNKKRFIIETHSQEFINRLRLQVIRNPDLASKINIVFVEDNYKEQNDNVSEFNNSDEIDFLKNFLSLDDDKSFGSKIKQFEIQSDGTFPEWPDGFLDESEKLAKDIIKARIQKKQNNG